MANTQAALEMRIARLEAETRDLRDFSAFLLALLAGDQTPTDSDRYSSLRRVFFGRYIDKRREQTATLLSLEITEAADEFREYLRDEEMLGLLQREA